MAAAYQKDRLSERELKDLLGRFDDTEQGLLLDALKAHRFEGAPMEEALKGWTKAVEAHRAEKETQQVSCASEGGK